MHLRWVELNPSEYSYFYRAVPYVPIAVPYVPTFRTATCSIDCRICGYVCI